ncbi:MAG: NAD(P)H-dependent glycerol-3-phosphate dehydrogenase [Aristaeellaceae bacterium]
MKSSQQQIGILGAGTWALALARVLERNGHGVTVWSAIDREIDDLSVRRVHPNLPGMEISPDIRFTKDPQEVCRDKIILLFAVPSVYVRATAARMRPFIPDGQIIVDVAKGIEPDTLLTMSEVIRDELQKDGQHAHIKLVALSGPTHAEEVALDMPTSIVSACTDMKVAEAVQDVFMDSCMRTYTNTDVLGVELCGALKNIMALATGVSAGMGYGDNAKAALITRGMAEISRLGLAMGCAEQTFIGLAGIGDLIVTATSVHSRNNRCGQLIGQGMRPQEAVKAVGMVVEGVNALPAAVQLAQRYQVDMPIVQAMSDIIQGGIPPQDIAPALMTRSKTSEVSRKEMAVRFESALLRRRNYMSGLHRRVMIQGRFDELSSEVIALLRRAHDLGDHLTVALQGADDTLAQRRVCLEELRPVNAVIPVDTREELRQAIRAQHINVLVVASPADDADLRDMGIDIITL